MGGGIEEVLLDFSVFVPLFHFLDILVIRTLLVTSCSVYGMLLAMREKGRQSQTATTMPILTNPGSFRFPALRPHSIRAFSSVATSRALNGILLALRIVSSRDVAVMMCEEPAVREV